MKSEILLNHDENIPQVEAEFKASFFRDFLLSMFSDNEDLLGKFDFIWPEEGVLSVEQKMELRAFLSELNIQVLDNSDDMKIFLEKDLIAEWHKPTYKLKRDYSALDKKKQLYIEMKVEYFSVFEEENDDT